MVICVKGAYTQYIYYNAIVYAWDNAALSVLYFSGFIIEISATCIIRCSNVHMASVIKEIYTMSWITLGQL